VQPSGLAGEIVLPPTEAGDPVEQFDRTPYIVGFQSARESFALLTAHIRYGDVPADRLEELKAVADYIATEIRDRAKKDAEENNLIVLGDFNIDDRGDNPLFQAFTSTGLVVPTQLLNLKTTYGTKPKFYDQIAWFMGDLDLLSSERAGVIDFAGAVFQELTPRQMPSRVSDHFPLWVEFIVDRSTQHMAQTLGLDPAMPDPLGTVPD
jgi:endonuclease/exonuclease/phosphatase family metal-dependent hydrolase